jgi:uncharacterized protein (TIRG00374 family)
MRKHLTRVLPWLITLLLVGFLIQQGGDLRDFQAVLGRAQWFWLLLAVVCQTGMYGAITWLNELLLRHYGVFVPRFRQYVIQLALAFVEAAIPSAVLSGLVLRARLLRPYGAAPDVATVTTLVETTLISTSVLVPALFVGGVAMMNSAEGIEAAGRLLPWLLCVVCIAVVAGWQWRRGWFSRFGDRIVGWFCHTWDQWIVHRWPNRLAERPSARVLERLRYLVTELSSLLHTRPYAIGASLLARTGFEALGFMMCFYAFSQPLPLTTLLLLYTITISINTLGAIPGGVGLAEVSLATLYTQFGIETESAVAVALAYRVTGYWLPRAAGGLSWLWLEKLH